MMKTAARFPIWIAIGLGLGLLIGLAFAHFLWVAVALVVAFTAFDFVRRRRRA
jgi:hypothetical protein